MTLRGLLQAAAAVTIVFSVFTLLPVEHHALQLFTHFRLQYLLTGVVLLVALAALRETRYAIALLLLSIVNAYVLLPWYVGERSATSGAEIRALLANDPAAAEFNNGFFHTIYLAPRDYHRVHMPMDGWLQRTIHVPGRLFSVSPATVRGVPDLFARNERVVSMFDTPHGPLAMVLVGAMLVSSMGTVWAGTVNPPRARRVERTDWSRRDIELDKGAEMGRFNMGSTVIVLLPPAAVASLEEFATGDPVLMGQRLGRLR